MKKTSLFKKVVAVLALGMLALLSACGGGGGGGGLSSSSSGTLKLALTDAPSCGYDHVYVTVDRVRVHQNANAGVSDPGWSEIVLNPAKRIDLLAMTNGVLEELGQTALPAGHYSQMRLVLSGNGSSPPFANSVVPMGGSETALNIPSGLQTGLKMNINIDVATGKVADFVLDFNACSSIVKRGNSGQYNLKPVVSVIPRLSDAGQRIVGYVDLSLATTDTVVSVQSAGVVAKSTQPDVITGQFVLYPVPEGTYDLVIVAPGRVTARISGVPVTATAYTNVGSNTDRILPPASSISHHATGSVSVSGSMADTGAMVFALQTINGGTVEVIGKPVDAVTGTFDYALPSDAPAYTAYSALPGAITFVQDISVAGLYRLNAEVTGLPTQSQDINISQSDTSTAFTF